MIGSLAKEVPPGFYTNLDEFGAAIAKDATFKPYGELLHSYTVAKGQASTVCEIQTLKH